ncbi:MAG: hypothetical protein ABJH72_13545 [Reichenbachiella sp.]|uniref:hypothetical protein n=1 Tax=Reichenbachiella sp. TaxID=2184521 RepID=UPI003263CE29
MKKLLTLLIFSLTFQSAFSQDKMIVEQSVCDSYNTDPYELKERIVNKEVKNDTLIIVLGKREICCATFTADYKLENDTLKINYENTGDECFCTCFYELTFKIPNKKLDSLQITFNGLQFEQTDRGLTEYVTKIDTLENGNVLRSKYENDELILEIEDQDSFKVYRQYYKGLLRQENRRK